MSQNRRSSNLAILAIALLAGAIATMPTTADAGRRNGGYVVAHSEFGNGSVSGPVRWTPKGPQVRLPGGSWVWCARSCSETLRVKTVDFWYSEEGAGERAAMTNDGGIFGRLRFDFGF